MKKQTAWIRARQLADRTPETRNRYVDFLRAVAIMAVVMGHWLIVAPSVEGGRLRLDHMLSLEPWTQWLTWVFQVMPVFFIVGGYSNAASWEAARKSGQAFDLWVTTRLRRLVGPILPLLLVWSVIGMLARQLGVDPGVIKIGSQVALIPVWFLAVYAMVVMLVPVTRWAWRHLGMGSFWALALAAAAVDVAALAGGFRPIGWVNYMFVWLAVHQLGYLWRDGRLSGPTRSLPWAAGGLVLLVGLVTVGKYPLSMVGVPGEEVSNTQPPNLTLLALGALQGGLLLAIEAPFRRLLRKPFPWTATILLNGRIMSIYLWHVTAMVLIIGLANTLGGLGLGLQPGSGVWWASRPIWIAILVGALFIFLTIFGRFERSAVPKTPIALPAWRTVPGTVMVCAGLALIALGGIGSDNMLGIRVWVLSLTFVGAALISFGPLRRHTSI